VVREHLELLSEATFSLTKAFGTTDQKLYYQHCPMANQDQGGYWLSAQKEIRNPYFGKAMLECGSTEEVLN
jgi:Cu(I)/Ag(I) efflux system membrane fusion protein